jgi:hypothetical protein
VCVPDLGQGLEAWKLEAPRWAKASCLAIDLPADLFRAVAPRLSELPYLAHVRQVDTGNKEVLGINDRGWFSVVVGNRVPRSRTAYRVLLVSLEGWTAWLDADPGRQPPACSLVRLAVLGSWGFVCAGSNDFSAHMQALNRDRNAKDRNAEDRNAGSKGTGPADAWLGLPFDAYDDQRANAFDPDALVNGAYARGYTALEHLMRQGERTVSWFRGPLVPLNYAKPVQVGELVGCADELLRYDPDWGLFDASFAAAWQMGRLLALQNQGFASALDRVRRRLRWMAEDSMRRHEVERHRQRIGLELEDTIEDGVLAFLASEAGRSAFTGAAKGGGAAPAPAPAGGSQTHESSFGKAAADASNKADLLDLAQVTSWLGRLVLLYGVPFQYLVPQEEMLPAGPIRFFFLDPIWVQCLVQGACSLGRTGYADGIVDQAMNRTLVPHVPADSGNASPGTVAPRATGVDASASASAAAGIRARLRQEREGITPPEDATALNWPVTGLLLRSPLVAGWRGLEILAFREVRDDERDRWKQDGVLDADSRKRLEERGVVPLAPLRIEQLGDDILIAIFNGVVAEAVVRQPQEGLHFGVTRGQPEGHWTKCLRNPDTGASLRGGGEIEGVVREAPPAGPHGVVDVVGLAERMQTQLKECGHPAGHFGSAAFALQMIESPLEVTFRAQYPEGS